MISRFLKNINVSRKNINTVASSLFFKISTNSLFQGINSLKKGKDYRCLERIKESGRFFLNRPLSSGNVQEGITTKIRGLRAPEIKEEIRQ